MKDPFDPNISNEEAREIVLKMDKQELEKLVIKISEQANDVRQKCKELEINNINFDEQTDREIADIRATINKVFDNED
jgi:hypothetical protein